VALPVFKIVRGAVMPSWVGSIPTRSRQLPHRYGDAVTTSSASVADCSSGGRHSVSEHAW